MTRNEELIDIVLSVQDKLDEKELRKFFKIRGDIIKEELETELQTILENRNGNGKKVELLPDVETPQTHIDELELYGHDCPKCKHTWISEILIDACPECKKSGKTVKVDAKVCPDCNIVMAYNKGDNICTNKKCPNYTKTRIVKERKTERVPSLKRPHKSIYGKGYCSLAKLEIEKLIPHVLLSNTGKAYLIGDILKAVFDDIIPHIKNEREGESEKDERIRINSLVKGTMNLIEDWLIDQIRPKAERNGDVGYNWDDKHWFVIGNSKRAKTYRMEKNAWHIE